MVRCLGWLGARLRRRVNSNLLYQKGSGAEKRDARSTFTRRSVQRSDSLGGGSLAVRDVSGGYRPHAAARLVPQAGKCVTAGIDHPCDWLQALRRRSAARRPLRSGADQRGGGGVTTSWLDAEHHGRTAWRRRTRHRTSRWRCRPCRRWPGLGWAASGRCRRCSASRQSA